MARRLEHQHGVVRDWRQCRTKYKNMKYDYKVSKSQGRPIRFFAELDAIMQGKDIEGGFEEDESSRNIPDREKVAMRREPVEEQVIKIDDGKFCVFVYNKTVMVRVCHLETNFVPLFKMKVWQRCKQ